MCFFDFGALALDIFLPLEQVFVGREQPPNRPPLRPRDVEPCQDVLSTITVYTHSLYSCLINIHTTLHTKASL